MSQNQFGESVFVPAAGQIGFGLAGAATTVTIELWGTTGAPVAARAKGSLMINIIDGKLYIANSTVSVWGIVTSA